MQNSTFIMFKVPIFQALLVEYQHCTMLFSSCVSKVFIFNNIREVTTGFTDGRPYIDHIDTCTCTDVGTCNYLQSLYLHTDDSRVLTAPIS